MFCHNLKTIVPWKNIYLFYINLWTNLQNYTSDSGIIKIAACLNALLASHRKCKNKNGYLLLRRHHCKKESDRNLLLRTRTAPSILVNTPLWHWPATPRLLPIDSYTWSKKTILISVVCSASTRSPQWMAVRRAPHPVTYAALPRVLFAVSARRRDRHFHWIKETRFFCSVRSSSLLSSGSDLLPRHSKHLAR